MIATSWTGSESQRRRGGDIPPPPSSPPDLTDRFNVPSGTSVIIYRLSGDRIPRIHRTLKPLGFERYESRTKSKYVFRYEGWLIEVRPSCVVLRRSERERLDSHKR